MKIFPATLLDGLDVDPFWNYRPLLIYAPFVWFFIWVFTFPLVRLGYSPFPSVISYPMSILGLKFALCSATRNSHSNSLIFTHMWQPQGSSWRAVN